MRRTVAALRPLWRVLLLVPVLLITYDLVAIVVPAAEGLGGGVLLGAVATMLVLIGLLSTGPKVTGQEPARLVPPVRGRWVAVNSPGQSLPSHGTYARGQYSAVDLCSPATETTPPLVRWGLRGNRPQEYDCFGAPIHAMAPGVVTTVLDRQRDQRARSTWPALVFMMTLEGLLRELGGTNKVLGNHVVIDHGDGTYAAYAHLKRGSAAVAVGQRVTTGQVIGAVGNTGNTTMPHLHVQLMDRRNVDAAAGLAMTWQDIALEGTIDPVFAKYAKEPADSALTQMPRNGELFTASAKA